FLDDFHGAHFGRAGDSAAGKGRGDNVEKVDARCGAAFDMRNDVHDMGVIFHCHELGDAHGAKLGNAAEIVADEVNQHQVFGAFLGVGGELTVQLAIFEIGGAAG